MAKVETLVPSMRDERQNELFTRSLLEEMLEKTISSCSRLEGKLQTAQDLVKQLKAAIAAK